MTIIDKDMGWDALERTVGKLGANPYVLVGVQGTDAPKPHPDSDLTNIELATIHEFGLGVPERSFIRRTIDMHEAALRDLLTVLGQRTMFDKLDATHALGLVGEETVGLIKQQIRDHIPPPLAAQTIKDKNASAIQRHGPGSTSRNGVSMDTSVPLIRSGTLINSITYRVVQAGPSSGEGV